MKILIDLYVQFFIIGSTAFGGGYAVLPLINSFVVEEKGWLSVTEMTDLVSISNMTPGPIGINAATFVGTKMAGISGSIVATLGFVTPSFVLMSILGFLEKMLKTLRPAIVGLIAIAALNMTINSVFMNNASPESFTVNVIPLICFGVGLVLYYKKMDLTKLIILGAAMGIGLSLLI